MENQWIRQRQWISIFVGLMQGHSNLLTIILWNISVCSLLLAVASNWNPTALCVFIPKTFKIQIITKAKKRQWFHTISTCTRSLESILCIHWPMLLMIMNELHLCFELDASTILERTVITYNPPANYHACQ